MLAVLAGGEGSRMGRAKGLLTIAGRPILSHILKSSRWLGPTLLVTSPGRENPPGAEKFDAQAVDPLAGLGPMRGVLTALEHATTDCVLVVPVDMPAVGSVALQWLGAALLQRTEASIVFLKRKSGEDDLIEPLPAGFRQSAADMLRERLREGRRSLHGLAGEARVQTIECPADWPAETWTNLNFPDDVARYERVREGKS